MATKKKEFDVRVKTFRTEDGTEFSVTISREDGGTVHAQMIVSALTELLPRFSALATEEVALGIVTYQVGPASDKPKKKEGT